MDQREAWKRIGASFDATRQRTWDHVEVFLDDLPTGARVLDVMCGNGRHLRPGMVGLDWSRPLVAAAGPAAVMGDATRLPFPEECFDAAICVAGLHGLPDPEDRAASLQELYRVLRPGGVAQVTVWSRDAPRFQDTPGDGPVDVVVPWRRDGHDVPRTYHLYTPDSLRAACEAAGFDAVALRGVAIAAEDPDNLVVVLRR